MIQLVLQVAMSCSVAIISKEVNQFVDLIVESGFFCCFSFIFEIQSAYTHFHKHSVIKSANDDLTLFVHSNNS